MPTLNIELDQGDFDELESFKDDHGLTWEGMLKYGTVRTLPYEE